MKDHLKMASWGACLALLLLLNLPAQGQVLYGSLVGTVTDASQAAVPGATVKVVDQGTNLTRETATSDAG